MRASTLRRNTLVAAFFVLSIVGVCTSQDYVNAMLPWHAPVFDSQHKLISWHQPETLGFDHVLHLGWDFMEHKIPDDPSKGTGMKSYLINSVFNPDTNWALTGNTIPLALMGSLWIQWLLGIHTQVIAKPSL